MVVEAFAIGLVALGVACDLETGSTEFNIIFLCMHAIVIALGGYQTAPLANNFTPFGVMLL